MGMRGLGLPRLTRASSHTFGHRNNQSMLGTSWLGWNKTYGLRESNSLTLWLWSQPPTHLETNGCYDWPRFPLLKNQL